MDLNNDRIMERKKQRIEALRIYRSEPAQPCLTDGSDSRCCKDAVSYRFTDLPSYRRAVVLLPRFTAILAYAVQSLVQQVRKALNLRVSKEPETYGYNESTT